MVRTSTSLGYVTLPAVLFFCNGDLDGTNRWKDAIFIDNQQTDKLLKVGKKFLFSRLARKL